MKMRDAFYELKKFKLDNTEVRDSAIYLHGNKIAEHGNECSIWITTAGWNTRTTFERLNGLYGCHVTKRKGILYLNEKEWDGKWIKILRV
jgi:hypothetical protein